MKVSYEKYEHRAKIVQRLNNMSSPPHLHNEMEFVLCLSGEMVATCNNITKTMHENDFVFVLPNTIHSYTTSKPSSVIWGIVSPECVPVFKTYFSLETENPFLFGEETIKIRSYCSQLLEEKNSTNVNSIVLAFFQLIFGHAFEYRNFVSKAARRKEDVVPKILQYLNNNFQHKLTRNSVAHLFGYSSFHFSKLFSARIGCTLTQYIHDLRIRHARTLLRSSNLTAVQIAYECGFSSQGTFNRVFRESEKMTPIEFRKLNRVPYNTHFEEDMEQD